MGCEFQSFLAQNVEALGLKPRYLEPFQQLAVITTSTHLARMLVFDEVIFAI